MGIDLETIFDIPPVEELSKKEKLEDIYNESPELRPTKKPKRLMR